MTEEVNSQNAAALNDINNEGGGLTAATNVANMTTTEANITEESKTPQIPVSASVIPTQRGIFSLKSKQQTSKDRFNQKAQTVPFKHPHDSFTVFLHVKKVD